MKTSYDCIPCFVRQALDAVRLATPDETIHESVLREVLGSMSGMDLSKSPPVMGQFIHRIIRKSSGSDDPYKSVKDRFNAFALDLYPGLKKKIAASPDRFETAVRLAIAGNIIDFGARANVDPATVSQAIEAGLSRPLFGDISHFHKAVQSAQHILYLTDNSGEIVFDRLLLEQLPTHRVTVAVRGRPVINDATIADASDAGLVGMVRVIDNGSDAPGTVLEDCSPEFTRIFQQADLIIAKGQGNYETLSGSTRPVFFLLKAKCPMIADHIGCEIGDTVLHRAGHPYNSP